jgi:lactoylglutathione lyase
MYANARGVLDHPRADLDQALPYGCELGLGQRAVGDIEEALSFYSRIFDFQLRGKNEDMAFIDLGDQFLALQKRRKQPPDDGRHFGLVADDKDAVRQALTEAGVEVLPGPLLDFLDPWSNRFEIVGYDNIQFTKAPNVLRGMGVMSIEGEQLCGRQRSARRVIEAVAQLAHRVGIDLGRGIDQPDDLGLFLQLLLFLTLPFSLLQNALCSAAGKTRP